MAPNTAHTPAPEPVTAASRAQMDTAVLANTIMKNYRGVTPELAQQVATLAKKYEKASFPKARDILAIVGIESSFNPNSVSQLSTDPAVGLMQVRPGVWDINPAKLKNSLELQIQTGAEILHKYFNQYGDISTAVHAYNVGPGNFRKGKHNPEYVHRFNTERNLYKTT
jgi:soluble lytic murein transglycosylase-like protein